MFSSWEEWRKTIHLIGPSVTHKLSVKNSVGAACFVKFKIGFSLGSGKISTEHSLPATKGQVVSPVSIPFKWKLVTLQRNWCAFLRTWGISFPYQNNFPLISNFDHRLHSILLVWLLNAFVSVLVFLHPLWAYSTCAEV